MHEVDCSVAVFAPDLVQLLFNLEPCERKSVYINIIEFRKELVSSAFSGDTWGFISAAERWQSRTVWPLATDSTQLQGTTQPTGKLD